MSGKFYHTKESVEEYIKIADGYDGRELIEKLQKYLPQNSNILELGSGPGTDLQILKEIYQITGSDYSAIFVDLLKDKFPSTTINHLNAVTIKTDKIFDGIFSNKVLQHLTDDELSKSILSQKKVLNDNGIICHSFWEGSICEEIHGSLQNYHTLIEIEKFFSSHFEILLLELYKEMSKNDSILLIGRKK